MSEASQEQTLFKGSSSPMMIAGRLTFSGIILLGALVFAFIAPPPYSYGLFVLAALALIYMIVQWLFVKARVYEVTTERIRTTNGILTRRTDEVELYRVKDTTLVEPFFMRMLNLGDIDVVTHDVSTPVVRLLAIKGARQLREELRKSIEACRDKKRVRLAELE